MTQTIAKRNLVLAVVFISQGIPVKLRSPEERSQITKSTEAAQDYLLAVRLRLTVLHGLPKMRRSEGTPTLKSPEEVYI